MLRRASRRRSCSDRLAHRLTDPWFTVGPHHFRWYRLRRKIATRVHQSAGSPAATTIAAAASTWNSSCGCEIQLKIWIGSAVKRASRCRRVEGDERHGADEEQRRRLADRAREREDDAGRDARRSAGQDLAPDRLPLRRAEGDEPSRIDGGTARIASREAMMTTGSTSRPSVMPPARTTWPRFAGRARGSPGRGCRRRSTGRRRGSGC